jgi:hypothetical protein
MAEKGKRKLDRSRPFGTVFGGGEAAFEQFGILFDGAGDELPGFEDVEIPEEVFVPAAGDESSGAAIRQLTAEVARLDILLQKKGDALADAEALAEELQGKLDTANIEIKRLQAQIDELSKPADVPAGNPGTPAAAEAPAGKGKKGAPAAEQSSLLDDQLKAQNEVG